jgi:5-methyltetrahydrofolate--homocysteine methyltransferase
MKSSGELEMEIFNKVSECVQKGELGNIKDLVQEALDQNNSPADILENGLILGMKIVGEKFNAGEIFVPEMLIAARVMNFALEILEPKMVKGDVQAKGKIVLGTVSGDLHDIGKNLVGIMFKGAGYEVIDAGVDVSLEKFLSIAKENKADIIGLSALLTTTLGNMRDIVKAVKESDPQIKVIIGGAPVTEDFANQIQADGFAANAAAAVNVAEKLLA